ncbi:uncharacterized protein LOC143302164 [Babylonia areolata]|uniref:uncharacterized protein LOC143302164 n=1 Tax=Babylonia areolata TaxID=304850 RepID=UPI003FD27AD3
MSFFSKKKDKESKQKEVKEKEKEREDQQGGKKSQFYVEFLGWMECRGVRGRRFTDPAIQELKRRQKKMDQPPKLTIQLTARELRISQDVEEKRKRSIKKVTFPPIPARDVTYVVQATRPSDNRLDDVVACIFLGYMPRTGKYVHVHVYRFDEPSTASTFAKLMGGLVADNLNRINDVERELAEKGEIDDPGLNLSDGLSEHATTGTDSAAGSVSGSGGLSENGSPTFGSDDMDADLQSLNDVQPFDSVAEELKYRLRMGGDAPLLLPPKDYDTISRARGNLLDINQRRCMNLSVVGEGAAELRPRNGSEESGIDLASPGSDGGGGGMDSVLNRFPAGPYPPAGPQASYPQENNNRVSPTSQGVDEFVYPPRQERGGGGGGGGGGGYPRSPAMSPALRRAAHPHPHNPHPHSPHTSPYGTRSSRTSHHSHHSDGAGSNGGSGGGDRAIPPVYSRSNSSSSTNNPVPVNVVEPLQDDFVPPTDYEDSFDEPVMMRRQPFLSSSTSSARPHSGTPLGGSPMLMRSLPANVMKSEMALQGSRSPRRSAEGDEYYFNAQRRSQPVYASHSLLESRPQSADLAGGMPRRVNSYR